ncbi:MAG: FAD-binding oxidoreductase [Candidatus Promineifilaceae bacterium]
MAAPGKLIGSARGQVRLLDGNGKGQLPAGALPLDKLERTQAWGGASEGMAYVFRPSTDEGLAEVFDMARRSGRKVGLRGAGNSYGDASLNDENILLDLSRMRRILEWEPEAGRIRLEPGVTIAQLWQYVLGDGWWPAVVPGTSNPTLGGCAGMNVHGKNAWKAGPLGEHIEAFELMLPSGELVAADRCSRPELFHAAIGGLGLLGVFTSLTLRLKKVHSGLLHVRALAGRDLGEMLAHFEANLDSADYLVGWIDATAGRGLGRGQVHRARYLRPGEDPAPGQSLRLERQHLPDSLFGVVPRPAVWRLMRPFVNDPGVRLVNWARYRASRLGSGKSYLQSHVGFHFLLDYVPDWKRAYGPGGLIQYQSFVPTPAAPATFAEMLRLCQRRGLPNYLSVLKRHKPDAFLLSHGLDGYSLAMDFRVTPARRPRLLKLAAELDEIVLQAGGRFYFAKDSTLRPEVTAAYLGEETLARFRAIKAQCDPNGRLENNLWRRAFGPAD